MNRPGPWAALLLPLLHHSCTATVVIAVQAVPVAHTGQGRVKAYLFGW
jgi:hypothetical protein